MNFFHSLRVLELSQVLAGPSVGRFFLECGAQVIKIENPTKGGDVTRKWIQEKEENAGNSHAGAYYQSVNEGKEILFLNLKSAKDKEHFDSLLQSTDILITNFPEGKEKLLALDKKKFYEKYPSLVWINICGYAKYPHRRAYDLCIQAEAGFMYLNREPGAVPQKMPVAFMDILAAHQAKEAALIALWNRERTGKGSYAEVYLFESALASWYNQSAQYTLHGIIPEPSGSLHPHIAPYGEIFRTADHHSIVLAIGSDEQFASFCSLINQPDILSDLRFSNNTMRIKNRIPLREILQHKISEFSLQILLDKCHEKNIPVGLIQNIPQAIHMADHKLIFHNGRKTIQTIAFRIEPNE